MNDADDLLDKNEIYIEGERCINQQAVPHNITIIIDERSTGNKLFLSSISGRGNVEISMADISNCLISIGKGNVVNNKLNINFYSVYGKKNIGTRISIGDHNIFNGGVRILAPLESGHCVEIGNNNLFAGGISIRGCNEHTIYDLTTKKKLDVERDTVISNHVWVCENVLLLSGSMVSDDSVIAANTLVNKCFSETNILIAGNPASVKKRNIGWDRKYCDSETVTPET